MNEEITLIALAEPWLKSVWSTAAKASALARSLWGPNAMAGLLQEPKSRAARRSLRNFLAALAALHCVSGKDGQLDTGRRDNDMNVPCASQSDTEKLPEPELAALAHALC